MIEVSTARYTGSSFCGDAEVMAVGQVGLPG